MDSLQTPILFIVFNRPEVTERVFACIRKQRPTRLYVAVDGPRPDREGEAERVAQTREIATRVDWPCELKTLFRATNLGCGKAVSQAISWFFEHEEEGIILEDDCLPHRDFFSFCSELLKRHRDDPRVLSISGDHFLTHRLHLTQPYYFSKYVQIWGWATWRRVWKHYDLSLGQLAPAQWEDLIRRVNPVKAEADYWLHIFRCTHGGHVDTWDFQMMFLSWHLGGLHASPSRNLVSNIGYGPEATHTNFNGSLAELPVSPLAIGEQVPTIEADPQLDNLIFYTRFLESMCHTWWLEQVLDPAGKLEGARLDALRAREDLSQSLRREKALERQNLHLTEALARAKAQRES